MTIWHTQAVYDEATAELRSYPGAATARHAFVEVRIPTDTPPHTAAMLLEKSAIGEWEVGRLYTADHEIPGARRVVVIGVW